MEIKNNTFTKKIFALTIFILLLFIFLIQKHPFDFLNNSFFNSQFSFDFDSQNVITWQYARFIELLPHRDIWYPHSGRFFYSLPFPPDVYFKFITNFFSIICFFVTIYNLFDKSLLKSLIFILILWWCDFSGLINFVDRYCYVYIFFLTFSTAVYIHSQKILFLSVLYGGLLFFLEPNIFFIGILSIVSLLSSIFLITNKITFINYKNFIKNYILYFFIPLVIIIMLYILFLHLNNSLNNFINFYKSFPDIEVSSSWPLSNANFYAPKDFLLLFAISLQGGFVINSFFNKKISYFWKSFYLSLFLIISLLLFKYAIRPHMAWQIFYFPIFFFIFVYIRKSNFINLKLRDYLFLTILFFILISSLKPLIGNIVSKSKNININFENIFNNESINLLKNNYFNENKFFIDGLIGSEFKRNLNKLLPDISDETFFVLGDDAYLYPLFNKIPFKYISLYNVSPRYDQIQLITQLENKDPKYVIFRSDFKVFDNVPNIVRTPLLYKYVVDNYGFKTQFRSFDILEKKAIMPNENLKYWQDFFGQNLNLESLIKYGNYDLTSCENLGKCENYIELININKNATQEYVEIKFRSENLSVTVKFKLPRNQSKIYLKLQNLWFFDLFLSDKNQEIVVSDNFVYKLKLFNFNDNMY